MKRNPIIKVSIKPSLQLLTIFFCCFIPLLSSIEIVIQGVHLEVEIASTQSEREKGLGGRNRLNDGTGMLFVYEKPQQACFWMKDTLIPLSIGFFDHEKRLISWRDMPLPGEQKLSMVCTEKPILYALEVPHGWFNNHKIQPGAKFSYILQSINKL